MPAFLTVIVSKIIIPDRLFPRDSLPPKTACFTKIEEGGDSEQVRYGSSVPNELLNMPVERFLSMVAFKNWGKLDDLGVKIDTNTLKFNH